jgi:hypothetical protein
MLWNGPDAVCSKGMAFKGRSGWLLGGMRSTRFIVGSALESEDSNMCSNKTQQWSLPSLKTATQDFQDPHPESASFFLFPHSCGMMLTLHPCACSGPSHGSRCLSVPLCVCFPTCHLESWVSWVSISEVEPPMSSPSCTSIPAANWKKTVPELRFFTKECLKEQGIR